LDVTSAATAINPPSDLKQMAVLLAKQFFTVRDCATITALSEKTILRLLKRGKLRCITSIRHKRIPATELARFIREDLG
jgi:excisionase family DNA binding protein